MGRADRVNVALHGLLRAVAASQSAQSSCVECQAALIADPSPPYCIDTCTPTEEQEAQWEDATHHDELDAATKEGWSALSAELAGIETPPDNVVELPRPPLAPDVDDLTAKIDALVSSATATRAMLAVVVEMATRQGAEIEGSILEVSVLLRILESAGAEWFTDERVGVPIANLRRAGKGWRCPAHDTPSLADQGDYHLCELCNLWYLVRTPIEGDPPAESPPSKTEIVEGDSPEDRAAEITAAVFEVVDGSRIRRLDASLEFKLEATDHGDWRILATIAGMHFKSCVCYVTESDARDALDKESGNDV